MIGRNGERLQPLAWRRRLASASRFDNTRCRAPVRRRGNYSHPNRRRQPRPSVMKMGRWRRWGRLGRCDADATWCRRQRGSARQWLAGQSLPRRGPGTRVRSPATGWWGRRPPTASQPPRGRVARFLETDERSPRRTLLVHRQSRGGSRFLKGHANHDQPRLRLHRKVPLESAARRRTLDQNLSAVADAPFRQQ